MDITRHVVGLFPVSRTKRVVGRGLEKTHICCADVGHRHLWQKCRDLVPHISRFSRRGYFQPTNRDVLSGRMVVREWERPTSAAQMWGTVMSSDDAETWCPTSRDFRDGGVFNAQTGTSYRDGSLWEVWKRPTSAAQMWGTVIHRHAPGHRSCFRNRCWR